jgi:hypothetical protein
LSVVQLSPAHGFRRQTEAAGGGDDHARRR